MSNEKIQWRESARSIMAERTTKEWEFWEKKTEENGEQFWYKIEPTPKLLEKIKIAKRLLNKPKNDK